MNIKRKLMNILPVKVIHFIEPYYYSYQLFSSKLRWKLFGQNIESKEIPIIINNYNRLEYLEKLISSLKKRGYNNIYILDNNSTYPPLLDFYKTTDVEVIHLGKNWGFRAIWDSGIIKRFWNSYYVYTDSDMELPDDCPEDFMQFFLSILCRYSKCFKVGFGLKIDDLPLSYKLRDKVIQHELQFWHKEIEPDLYEAPIDTTFALYRPYTGTSTNLKKLNIRTGGKYQIKHLPWYVDSNNLTAEEKNYINTISNSTHWSKFNKSDAKEDKN